MELLSATDAIGPAFARTRSILIGPGRTGSFLKLALVAALTQPAFFSAVFTYPLQGAQLALNNAMQHRHAVQQFSGGSGLAVAGLAIFAVIALIMLVLWVSATYLFCRFRFVLFDLVLYREGAVGMPWRKYRRQAWRYFGVLFLGMMVFLLLAAVFAGPAFLHLAHTSVVLARHGGSANPFALLGALLPIFVVLFALSLLYSIFDAIAQDFLLPPIALEDAPIEGAFGHFKNLFAAYPGQTLLYLLLRLVLGIGLSAVLMLAVAVVVGLLAVASGLLGVLLFHLLWTHGIVARAVFMAAAVVLPLLVLGVYLCAAVSVYGVIGVFKQSYALYFYAPRYLELGRRLDPPHDAPPVALEVPPPPPLPPLSSPPIW